MNNQVRLQHCPACVRWYAMPRDRCGCGTDRPLLVEPVAGHGTVFSYTVTHQAMTREYGDRVPYQTVLVELAEGPRVLALVEGTPVPIGAGVTVADAEPVGEHVPTTAMVAVAVERSRP